MKGITKIAVLVAVIAILVLSIVVATVAWFTSNPNVDANNVTLNAAKTLTVTFDSSINGAGYKYNGQTGRAATGADAPYVYEAGGFTVSIRPSAEGKGGTVRVEFGSVEIKYGRDISSATTATVSDIPILELFHVEAHCYVKDNAGSYVNILGVYTLDDGTYSGEQHYSRSSYTIADDGYVMDGGNVAVFPQGDYGLAFTYTFLPEKAYTTWSAVSNGDYSGVYGYRRNTTSGAYYGLISYVPYKAKYHAGQGLTRYTLTEGHGTESAAGGYVREITSYALIGSVTKYAREGDVYTESATGTYVKIGTSDDYVELSSLYKFDRIEGFPYQHERYMDATYTFDVTCSVEEVEVE